MEWRTEPVVTVEGGGDTNIWLNAFDQRYVSRGSVSASADIFAREPGFEFRLKPEVRALRYADNREADRDDVFTTFGLTRTNERGRWTFGSDYSRESTLTSEFTGTGILGLDLERTEHQFDTGWSRVMSARGTFSVNAVAENVTYGYSELSPFSDYDYRVFQTGYTLATSLRSSWQFSLARSVLTAKETTGVTSNKELRVAWTHAFSEKLRGTFGITTFDAGANGPTAGGHLSTTVNFAFTREWPRWTLQSAGSSDVRPEGRGFFVQEDSVTLDAQRRFGDRLSLVASMRYARIHSQGLLALLADRDYSQVGMNVNWRLNQRWVLSGGHYERAQEWSFLPRAEGRTSTVAFSYRGR
jgi:hypothetical protein